MKLNAFLAAVPIVALCGEAAYHEGRRLRQQLSNSLSHAGGGLAFERNTNETVTLTKTSMTRFHGKNSTAEHNSTNKTRIAVHNASDHLVDESLVHRKAHIAFMQIAKDNGESSGEMAGSESASGKSVDESAMSNDDDEDDGQDSRDLQLAQKDETIIAALRKNVSRLDGMVDINVHSQRRIESEIERLDNTRASDEEIKESTAKVVNETSSPGLGRILRKMWTEMRMYAWPFYKEHLEDDLKELKDDEQHLQTQLAVAEDKLEEAQRESKQKRDAKDKEEDKEEDTEEDNGRAKKNKSHEDHQKEGTDDDGDADEDTEGKGEEEGGKSRAAVIVAGAPSPAAAQSPGPALAPASPVFPSQSKMRSHKAHKTLEYEPLFTEDTMPAVSPTLQCVLILTVQFFITYAAHAIIRTVNNFSNQVHWNLQRIAEQACRAITYAPALCVLFLVTRLRAIQLSGGETEKYALPPVWAQHAMYVCTFALPVQALAVLVATSMVKVDKNKYMSSKKKKKTGDKKDELKVDLNNPNDIDAEHVQPVTSIGEEGKNKGLKICMAVVNFSCLVAMYGGMTLVCVAAITMEGPAELWQKTATTKFLLSKLQEPPVSTTLQCTLVLVTTFFVVYLACIINRIIMDLTKETNIKQKLNWVLTHAQETVNLVPMLCILFIALRMRALQVNPQTGSPQSWAQYCMVGCVTCLLIKALAAVLLPLADKTGEGVLGTAIGEDMFPFKNKGLRITAAIIKHTCMLLIVVCVLPVMAAVFLIQSPKGPHMTPHISPVMNVIFLCNIYILAHAATYIMDTIKDILPKKKAVHLVAGIVETGRRAAMFAPMLAVLFIACRMRALQLTRTVDGKVPATAGPQFWAQEAMYVASAALLVRMVVTYLEAALRGTGNTVEQDLTETEELRQGNKTFLIMVICNYLCLLTMFVGATVVMMSIFSMTPETLPPFSSQ